MKMILEEWVENGWLRRYETGTEEIGDLFSIVARDLKDAKAAISPDWPMTIR